MKRSKIQGSSAKRISAVDRNAPTPARSMDISSIRLARNAIALVLDIIPDSVSLHPGYVYWVICQKRSLDEAQQNPGFIRQKNLCR